MFKYFIYLVKAQRNYETYEELKNVHLVPHAEDSSRTIVWTMTRACNILLKQAIHVMLIYSGNTIETQEIYEPVNFSRDITQIIRKAALKKPFSNLPLSKAL